MKKSTVRQNKYDKNNTVRYSIKLNTTTDSDIIQKIEDTATKLQTSKQGAIKHLIRR